MYALTRHVDALPSYAMGWDAVLSVNEFSDLNNPGFFNPAKEQEHAQKTGIVYAEVAQEQAKVREADLMIFQFPVWWFSMPAILKG